jgi:hypothetical protein
MTTRLLSPIGSVFRQDLTFLSFIAFLRYSVCILFMSAVACHFLRFTVQFVGQAIFAIVANWNFEEKSEMEINRNCYN